MTNIYNEIAKEFVTKIINNVVDDIEVNKTLLERVKLFNDDIDRDIKKLTENGHKCINITYINNIKHFEWCQNHKCAKNTGFFYLLRSIYDRNNNLR
jgi:hypothetical protein